MNEYILYCEPSSPNSTQNHLTVMSHRRKLQIHTFQNRKNKQTNVWHSCLERMNETINRISK